MILPVDYAEILRAAEQLEVAAQAELIAALSQRLAERNDATADPKPTRTIQIRSPRLAHQDDARFFIKEMTEESVNAGL